jgi:2-polyprenyl-6-hydroxyphenyl methylase/3-demethylubiquinone-9 3-methyltransferase
MTTIIRQFIDFNVRLSGHFDRMLPERYQIDGNADFQRRFCPIFLKPGSRLVDVGGGKTPLVNRLTKGELKLCVTGFDVSQEELDKAPEEAYDDVICADITTYRGTQDADLLICQAVLEHVQDVEQAFAAFASILKPQGLALLWVPSRHAAFARLNMLLPEKLKHKILFFVFPHMKGDQGFPVYYDRCTPRQFQQLARKHGFTLESERLYYSNKYFYFFLPLHVLWRVWLIVFRAVRKQESAETFSMALRKL